MTKILELFCGTKSFSKVINAPCVSVDIDPKMKPDILSDIMDLDYKSLWTPGEFHYIHASPPCTDYSKINHAHPNKVLRIDYFNSIVKRTIDIINYLKPKYWTMENPQTGTLKDQPFMKELDLPYFDIDYCRFGYPYRKRTRFWSNIPYDNTFCLGKGECPGMDGNRHKKSCGNGRYGGSVSLHQRYSVPPEFIKDLWNKIMRINPPLLSNC